MRNWSEDFRKGPEIASSTAAIDEALDRVMKLKESAYVDSRTLEVEEAAPGRVNADSGYVIIGADTESGKFEGSWFVAHIHDRTVSDQPTDLDLIAVMQLIDTDGTLKRKISIRPDAIVEQFDNGGHFDEVDYNRDEASELAQALSEAHQ